MPPRRSLRIIDRDGRQNINNMVNAHINRLTSRANVYKDYLKDFMRDSSHFSEMSPQELFGISKLMIENYDNLRDLTNELQALHVNVDLFIRLLLRSEPIIGRNINVLRNNGYIV